MKTAEKKYTRLITCPHCGYEYPDSWEMGKEGEAICDSCELEFEYYSEITIDYFSKPIKRNEPKNMEKRN